MSYLFPVKSNSLSISTTSNIPSAIYETSSYSNNSEDLSAVVGIGYCYNFSKGLGLGANLSYRSKYLIKEEGVLNQDKLDNSETYQTIS